MDESIRIVVAHARPEGAYLRELRLPRGATVGDALQACDLNLACPELDLGKAPVGVFGRKVGRDHVLHEDDRVEVYRPLRIDPMQARRLRAERQKR